MLFLEKHFVHELMINKYPLRRFDPPVACTFNLCVDQFGGSMTTLIQSVLGVDSKACLVGAFEFIFLREPTPDRSYSINIGIEDYDRSMSLIAAEMESMTEEVSKQLTESRSTIRYNFPYLELKNIDANYDAAAFIKVNVLFVGWKVTSND